MWLTVTMWTKIHTDNIEEKLAGQVILAHSAKGIEDKEICKDSSVIICIFHQIK